MVIKKKLTQRSKVLILIGVVSVLLFVSLIRSKRILVDAVQVQRGVFREVLEADGILRSQRRHIVPAFADGDMKRMDLRVGDHVRKGQVLTELYWDIKYEPVRSPMEGVISKVYRESAGPIRRGEPIVEVSDPRNLEAVIEFLTVDAVRIKPGDPALLLGWGGPAALQARVRQVSQAGFTKQSALGVEEERTEVQLDLDPIPAEILTHLGTQFHVEVKLEIGRYANALILPVGAIFRAREGWAVYRIIQGVLYQTPVQFSIKSQGQVLIVEGLKEEDWVVLYPGDLVRDGSKVRLSKAG